MIAVYKDKKCFKRLQNLDITLSKDYGKVCKALLDKYNIDTEDMHPDDMLIACMKKGIILKSY